MTTTPPETGVGRYRTPRWLWIALILSLAINLLIVGMAAAAMMHFRKGHGGPSARFAHYVSQLPEERRIKLSNVLDERRSKIRPLRKQARAARRRAREAFAAEPFDKDKLIEVYKAASEARMVLETARGAWFTKLAELLTAQERRKLLKWRDRHRHGRRWRRRHHD